MCAGMAGNGAMVDMYRGRDCPKSGTLAQASGKFGFGYGLTQTSAYIDLLPTSGLLPRTDCTIMVIYAKRDTTNRASRLFAPNATGGTSYCSVHGPYSDGTVYWDYGGVSSGTTRLSAAGQTWTPGVPSVWFFTVGERGMEIWRDGLRIANNAARPTRTVTAGAFRLGATGTETADLVDYYALNIWKRQLSDQEISQLSAEPWSFYSEPPSMARMFYAMLAGDVISPGNKPPSGFFGRNYGYQRF